MADDNYLKTTTMPETDRKCPNCGGTLTYDAKSGEMFCSLCGKHKSITDSPFRKETVESIPYEPNVTQPTTGWGEKIKLLTCANCGAEVIHGATQISGSCPFCGSTNISAAAETDGIMAPNGILPFAIDEKKARQMFSNYLFGLRHAPKGLKDCSLDSITPLYLPYWVFEAYTVSHYELDVGFLDDENRIYYRKCKGYYRKKFDEVPVCASSKVLNSQIDELKNFNFYSTVPYTPEYMAGYYAERYSTTLYYGWESAQENIEKKLKGEIEADERAYQKGSVSSHNLNFTTEYSDIKYRYIIAPVYLASFTYRGKKYDVAINGKTGEVACNPPSTLWIRRLLFVLLLVTIAVIIFLIVCKCLI